MRDSALPRPDDALPRPDDGPVGGDRLVDTRRVIGNRQDGNDWRGLKKETRPCRCQGRQSRERRVQRPPR